jgi:hypothetical protein
MLNPKFEIRDNNPIKDIIADAKPTFSSVYILAAINQKINPVILPITEFITRYDAFLNKEVEKIEYMLIFMFFS